VKLKYKLALMDMAERFGQTSTSKRLKVGTLIYKNDSVISLGVNGMPPGWDTEECEDDQGNTKPECRHSEDAALQKLWNSTETADGATMFVSHSPCRFCSIKILTAGISTVYYRHDYRDSSGIEYLKDHGVKVIKI